MSATDTADSMRLRVRRPWTLQQIRARERHEAAIHEAGHVAIARWAGLTRCAAWLAPNPGGGPDSYTDETFFTGQFVCGFVDLDWLRLRHTMMLGIAGAVAERVWGERNLADPDLWIDETFFDDLSHSDRRNAGIDPAFNPYRDDWPPGIEVAFNRTVELLWGALWPFLLTCSRTLMTQGEWMPTRLRSQDALSRLRWQVDQARRDALGHLNRNRSA